MVMWFDTAGEKYGAAGIKGDQGERLYYDFAVRRYDSVSWNQSNKADQAAGADFSIKNNKWPKAYTVDVKANLKSGDFYIDNKASGWLWAQKKVSDIIVHLDIDTGDLVQYYRKDMKSFMVAPSADHPWLVKKNMHDNRMKSILNLLNINR